MPTLSLANDSYLNINSINNVKSDNHLALNSFQKLPFSTRAWLWFEQTHNPKSYDKDFYPKPDQENLQSEYCPENRPILSLAVYEIPKNYLASTVISGSSFASKLIADNNHMILLVHPSVRNDQLMLQFGFKISNRKFFFLPAASARTGLTWEFGKEHEPFFTKMSIAGNPNNPIMPTTSSKTDLGQEGIVSVAKTSIFSESCKDLTKNFFQDQMEMQLSSEIKTYTQSSYGLVFRRIPNEVVYSNIIYAPFFALAHTPIGKKPLFITLLENSGYGIDHIEQFFSKYIFNPVIEFILKNSMYGIYADHLHGQNLLFKLNCSNKLQMVGEVIYRDAPDMKVDEKSETAFLKNVRTQQNAEPTNITPGTYIYLASVDFVRRSLAPILNAISNWQKNRLLTTSKEISGEKVIFSFFNQLLTSMKDNLSSDRNGYTCNYFNSVYEFLACTQNDSMLFRNTAREREWHNTLLSNLKNIYSGIIENVTPDLSRQNKLKSYLRFHIQDSIEKYRYLDKMNAATQYSTLIPAYNRLPTTYINIQNIMQPWRTQPVLFHSRAPQARISQENITPASQWIQVAQSCPMG